MSAFLTTARRISLMANQAKKREGATESGGTDREASGRVAAAAARQICAAAQAINAADAGRM